MPSQKKRPSRTGEIIPGEIRLSLPATGVVIPLELVLKSKGVYTVLPGTGTLGIVSAGLPPGNYAVQLVDET